MKKDELISLIENDQPECFIEKVFKNQVAGGNGGFYVASLSAEEEKALVYRVSSEQKDSRWYKVLRDYMSHYSLTNEALYSLITEIRSSMAVKIICSDMKSHGYNTDFAEKICHIIKKEKCDKVFLPLLSAISRCGRSLSEDLYRILVSIDESLCEQNSENPGYAQIYKKRVYEYRKQNGLLNFHS